MKSSSYRYFLTSICHSTILIEKLAAGSSCMEGNDWSGEVVIRRVGFDDKEVSSIALPAGVSSITWLNEELIVAGLDDGDITVLKLTSPILLKHGNLLEHDSGVICVKAYQHGLGIVASASEDCT